MAYWVCLGPVGTWGLFGGCRIRHYKTARCYGGERREFTSFRHWSGVKSAGPERDKRNERVNFLFQKERYKEQRILPEPRQPLIIEPSTQNVER